MLFPATRSETLSGLKPGIYMNRSLSAPSNIAAGLCLLACLAFSGCAHLRQQNVATSDSPPDAVDFSKLGITPPTDAAPAADSSTPAIAAEEPLTIRGQDSGFSVPPGVATSAPTPSPGGGGFTRGPVPVSGQNVQPPLVQPQAATAGGAYGTTATDPRVAQNGVGGYQAQVQPAPNYGLPAPPADYQNYNNQPVVPNQQTFGQPPVAPQPGMIGAPIEPINPNFVDPLSNEPPPLVMPRVRTVPVDVFVTPARTGRFMVGGAVNSDAGVTGQIVLDERNFDILRFPRSFQDLFSGYAFRGAGQTFRLEAVPGSDFQRYMMSFGQPYLFGYLPLSLSVQGFLFDRQYRDWDESRLGGRVQLGYRVTNELSLSTAIRAENVDFGDVRVPGIPYVDQYVGNHELYSGSVRLSHDTRDIPFAPTEGHLFEVTFEQTFGSYDYSRIQADLRNYYLLRERADHSGRHTIAVTNSVGFSGADTPIFENFFAGGYSTMRGFDFRGASPVITSGSDNVQVGGRLSVLGSVEYQFPLTADDATKGVVFVDYGTVEREIEIKRENFRVAPGFGFRVSMPALGPAPLAFDFAFPVAHADTDDRQVFSFFMGFSR
ncbi:BamA/OMP85 family outer membrane protein [Rosistilla ulvae]|uniref:BamA/OMP85 family outer membrane protein n=1 Tax=Rosistilla ulvae TaxID=1930277 RepID=UPI001FE34822|nr:BamA/TamA family outer membrane protein [Rosistilla ulvae]